MAQEIKYFGVTRIPTQWIGTDAERIAKPAGELVTGDFWLVDNGTNVSTVYTWNGTAWRQWLV